MSNRYMAPLNFPLEPGKMDVTVHSCDASVTRSPLEKTAQPQSSGCAGASWNPRAREAQAAGTEFEASLVQIQFQDTYRETLTWIISQPVTTQVF